MSDNCPECPADEIADKAVKKCFAILGVDIDKPDQVESFRESLRFGDKLRKAADRGFFVFVSTLVTIILVAIGYGIKEMVSK